MSQEPAGLPAGTKAIIFAGGQDWQARLEPAIVPAKAGIYGYGWLKPAVRHAPACRLYYSFTPQPPERGGLAWLMLAIMPPAGGLKQNKECIMRV